MEIQGLGIPSAPVDMKTSPQKEPDAPLPSESFSKGSDAGQMMNISGAGSMLSVKTLDKRGMGYRYRSAVTAKDGTTYIAYASTKPPKDDSKLENVGYVSAVSPQGEILWESPVNEEGLCEVRVGSDGTIYARTKENLRALQGDGTLKFEHRFEEPVREHYMDSSGNHYFVKESSRELCVLDRDGAPMELPEAFRGVKGSEIIQASPDELYMRDGEKIVQLDLKEGQKKSEITYKDPVEPKSNFSRSIDHMEIDGKGVVRLWIRNNTYVASGPPIDDLHMGLGFGFGHRWGFRPHLPPDDQFYSTTTICDMSMEKLGKDGKITGTVNNLDSNPKHVMLQDGTVIYSNNAPEYVDNPNYVPNAGSMNYSPKTIGSGKYFVSRIAPGGMKNEQFIKVDGRIKEIMTDPETGSFFICHGENTVTEYSPDGKALRSQTVPAGDKSPDPVKMAGSNAVIFKDTWGDNLWSLDMDSGKFTPLTDNERDFSFKVIAREMDASGDETLQETGEGIQEFDDWVNVDGVKISKKE